MTIIQAIILGIVEGITEFLPVSSTGHMILASKILGMPDTDFLTSFEIIIQFGAILAVVVLFWKRLISDWVTWKRVLTAFFPTAVIGFLLYKVIKHFLWTSDIIVVWSLFLGGLALIAFEWWYRHERSHIHRTQDIGYSKSFAVGLAQSLAVIPGVSRSAATIVGGMMMGVSRQAIVEFSFLLAVPTMAAATGYDLLKSSHSFTGSQFGLLAIGFIVAFFVALTSIKWFINFIKGHSFIGFGVYRIIAAVLFWLLVIQLHW